MLLAFSLSLSFRSDATAACQVRSGELGACFVRHTMPEAYVGTHTRNGPQRNFSEVLSFRGSGSRHQSTQSKKEAFPTAAPAHFRHAVAMAVREMPPIMQTGLLAGACQDLEHSALNKPSPLTRSEMSPMSFTMKESLVD